MYRVKNRLLPESIQKLFKEWQKVDMILEEYACVKKDQH